jgi:hypothetical protein
MLSSRWAFELPPAEPAQPDGTTVGRFSSIDWMRTCSDITVTGLPAISVPCGFDPLSGVLQVRLDSYTYVEL